jgi:hypothetical protein
VVRFIAAFGLPEIANHAGSPLLLLYDVDILAVGAGSTFIWLF